MEEITLPTEQVLKIIIALVPIVILLWHNMGRVELHRGQKGTTKGKDTRKLTNANYGAYMQLQGKYYN